MHARNLVLLLATALALSGCLGLGGDDVDPDPDQDASPSQDPAETGTPDEEETQSEQETNPPVSPSAGLSANETKGGVPLVVSFSLEGSHPSIEEIAWSLDAGDGSPLQEGDTLPATVNHTYDEVGTFTATLEVTAGEELATDTLNLTVEEVEEPAIGGPNEVQTGETTLCLDYLLLWALNQDPGPGGVHSPLGDTENVTVDPGTGYTIDSGDNQTVIDFYDASGFYLGSGADAGVVPDAAAYGFVCVILGEVGEWPEPPLPMSAFAYQDGF